MFSFNAPFYGSAGGIALDQPVVGGLERQLLRRLLAGGLGRRSLHVQPDGWVHAFLRVGRLTFNNSSPL